jgi:hypothetical protein
MEDFVKKRGIDLLYGGRIAAPCIVYETVDAAVMALRGTTASRTRSNCVTSTVTGGLLGNAAAGPSGRCYLLAPLLDSFEPIAAIWKMLWQSLATLRGWYTKRWNEITRVFV